MRRRKKLMIFEAIKEFLQETGIVNLDYKSAIMLCVSVVFLYLAINRGFEPLLLVPIAFGMLLSNLPISGIFSEGGLLYSFYELKSIFPSLIFLGVGAMTDFGPLIANPKSLLLGAAAQLGIFSRYSERYYLDLMRRKLHRLVSSAELMAQQLLYTSDAADEEDSVDLGGGRIIQ